MQLSLVIACGFLSNLYLGADCDPLPIIPLAQIPIFTLESAVSVNGPYTKTILQFAFSCAEWGLYDRSYTSIHNLGIEMLSRRRKQARGSA